MLRRLLGISACGVLLVGLTQLGIARGKSGAGHSVTVTGCLAQGDKANEYAITGDDGKTYGLRSSAVNLKEHMGHKVTVTGTMSGREMAKTNKTEASTGKPEESAHLNVKDLKMVSTTCP